MTFAAHVVGLKIFNLNAFLVVCGFIVLVVVD